MRVLIDITYLQQSTVNFFYCLFLFCVVYSLITELWMEGKALVVRMPKLLAVAALEASFAHNGLAFAFSFAFGLSFNFGFRSVAVFGDVPKASTLEATSLFLRR